MIISRRTQFNITGLKPNTEYRVGIRTRDVSRWSTKVVDGRFKTKEAGTTNGFFNCYMLSFSYVGTAISSELANICTALDFVYCIGVTSSIIEL